MTNWPSWLRAKVREFLTASTGRDWPQRAAQAARLLEELPDEPIHVPGFRGARPARREDRPRIDKSALPFGVKPGPTQRDRTIERNDRMNAIRWIVLARAAGRCEFCGVAEPTDGHHVIGGSDRRALESEYTLAAICGEPDDPKACHGKCNASPAWARTQGLAWARRMEAAARAAIAGGDLSATTTAAATGFASTAELLEARVALAAAQARPVTTTIPEDA